VVEQKARCFLERRTSGGELADGPDQEPEETGVEGVAGEGQERHDQHGKCRVAEGDHAIGRKGKTEIVDHGLGRIESPPGEVLALRYEIVFVLGVCEMDPRD
jgi:hypothetical protein